VWQENYGGVSTIPIVDDEAPRVPIHSGPKLGSLSFE